jgi:hypothetical protein
MRVAYFTLFALTLMTLQAHSAVAISRCPALLARGATRIVIKNRKEPYSSYGSVPTLVKLEHRGRFQKLADGVWQTFSRQAKRSDYSVHLINGPLGKFTESRFGQQKELTLTTKIVTSLIGPVPFLLHVLFPRSILDPEVWNEEKEKLTQKMGVEWNQEELEYYLRNHPLFNDLHGEFLAEVQRNPKAKIEPYLKLVRERMDEELLMQQTLQELLPSETTPKLSDFNLLTQTLNDNAENPNAIDNLPAMQRTILERFIFAQELAKQDDSLTPVPFRNLKKSLQHLFATINQVNEGGSLDRFGLQNTSLLSSEFLASAQGFMMIDSAITRLMSSTTNAYWQLDLHVEPKQLPKYVEQEPLYALAAKKLFEEEKDVHARIQSMRSRTVHPYYLQQALNEYGSVKLDYEWMNELGLASTNPNLQSPDHILAELERQLLAKGRLK